MGRYPNHLMKKEEKIDIIDFMEVNRVTIIGHILQLVEATTK